MRMLALAALSLTLLAYLSTGAYSGYRGYKGPAVHAVQDFLDSGRAPSTKTVVVTIGDSLTQGTFSTDYVEALRHTDLAYKGFEFVNAGINGEKLADVLKRSQEILACRPDAITILIGTNDVQAYLSRRNDHSDISLSVSLAAYRRDLQSLISVLRSSTSHIAVLSIPPLGEDLLSPENKVVERYNEVAREICEQNGVSCLPIYERARVIMDDFHGVRNIAKPSRELSRNVAIRHFFLWQSWDQISQRNGFVIHTDGIHLNNRGAQLIADHIQEWLTNSFS